MKNKTVVRLVKFSAYLALAITVVGIVFFIWAQYYIERQSKGRVLPLSDLPVCDVILILGARVYEDKSPSPILKYRLDYGYELYLKGKAKRIIVSGDDRDSSNNESNSMKQYLMKKGIPSEVIIVDKAGYDTYDSMYRARELFSVKSMIICTQEFHIKRAIYIADKLGIEAYGYPSPDMEIFSIDYLRFRESFARCKAIIETEITKRKAKNLNL